MRCAMEMISMNANSRLTRVVDPIKARSIGRVGMQKANHYVYRVFHGKTYAQDKGHGGRRRQANARESANPH